MEFIKNIFGGHEKQMRVIDWESIIAEVDAETKRQEEYCKAEECCYLAEDVYETAKGEEDVNFILEIEFVNNEKIHLGVHRSDSQTIECMMDNNRFYRFWEHCINIASPRIKALNTVLAPKFPEGIISQRQQKRFFESLHKFDSELKLKINDYSPDYYEDWKIYYTKEKNRTFVPHDIWLRLLGEIYMQTFDFLYVDQNYYEEQFLSNKCYEIFCDLSSRYSPGDCILGKIEKKEKGGAIVNFERFPAFLPANNMSEKLRRELPQSIGKKFEFVVNRIDLKNNRIILASKKEKKIPQDQPSSADITKLIRLIENQNSQIQQLQKELKKLKEKKESQINDANQKKYF